MLIRFFKEIDLIGCGGDTQPIRLQVGTLSQSDYRYACRGCVQGLQTRVACAGVVHKGCMHRGCAQGLHTRVAHAGVLHKGCVHRGSMQGLCMQGLHAQGWWGPSANQITQGLHASVVCTRVEGTLSQSDYTGVAHKDCACKGCTQGLHMQGWRGHSANQITQGLHARVACTGVVCRGCMCKGCVHRGCMQGLLAQGLHTRVACAGVVHRGCV